MRHAEGSFNDARKPGEREYAARDPVNDLPIHFA
jgi:hypothetical protein